MRRLAAVSKQRETPNHMRHPPTTAHPHVVRIGALTLALYACGSSGGESPSSDGGPPSTLDAGQDRTEVDTGVPVDAGSSNESGSSRDAGQSRDAGPESGADSSLGSTDPGGGDAGSDSAAPPSGLWSNPNPSGPPAFSGPTVSATVAVTQGKTVGHVGPGFVGLSYEKSHMTDQFFTSDNAPLIAMCKILGPSVVRIGGNSVDRTLWQPSAPASGPSSYSSSIGTADVDDLGGFLQASGWKVIYGLNLKTSTAELASAEATYASGRLGSSVEAFEIGNEPDLYGETYAEWSPKWASFATAIESAVPHAPLAGPATAGGGVYEAVDLAHDEASVLTLLTQHYYRGAASTTSPASVIMTGLLSPDPGLISTATQLSGATTANHTPLGFRLAEANSYFNHGSPGVSDALGSALWAIDFLFQSAENGSSGANFHGGGAGQDGAKPFIYTPINEVNGVVTGAQPIFYGMLLVASTGGGSVLSTTITVPDSLNVTAYAVTPADGSTDAVIVNKDTTHGIEASVNVGRSVATAAAVFLEGPSLLALSGVTFAGAGISPAGAWTPMPAWTLPVAGEVVSVVVPPASAVIVHAN
jgi:hypothetical protein